MCEGDVDVVEIPKEQPLTRMQIQKKVNPLRTIMALMTKFKKTIGKEMFLNTEAGKVRVLAYNMDNPEKLPLFVNIHGGGFVIGNAELDDPYLTNVAENANVKILNIDYSLSPDVMFPVALNECYAVVKYAKEHSEELNIDTYTKAFPDIGIWKGFYYTINISQTIHKQFTNIFPVRLRYE